MALVINTNIASLSAQKNLVANTSLLSTSVQRLSSGLRINSAKDDASGLAVSEKLRAQVKSISVAIRNSQDGVSLAQTTEGGLVEIGNILSRMRELAEQAANGTVQDRTALDNEYTQMIQEIDRIALTTEFNGVKLLNGDSSATGVSLQVGFQNSANDRIAFFSGIGVTGSSTLGLTGTFGNISIVGNAQSALAQIDSAINTVATRRGTLGAVMNRLESTIANLRVAAENLGAAESAIRDADFAFETSQFTRNQILVQAATAMVAQANVLPQAALQLLK
ncbi:MAG: flagellin FliC [Deltaproteobacteria bacterium]|nr:flagellin FliC [Deltaproteobacteria bacterium]